MANRFTVYFFVVLCYKEGASNLKKMSDKQPLLEDLGSALNKISQTDDAGGTSSLYRFPEGSMVKAFRRDPKVSLKDISSESRFAAALNSHQNGDHKPLQEYVREINDLGIRLELRTYPGTDLITGIALVSKSFDKVEWLKGPLSPAS